MTLEQLRLTHPRFIYKSYRITKHDASIELVYEFLLEPDIVFRPTVTIPFSGDFDQESLAPFVFHLGLVEAISYWKAACAKEFVIEAGAISREQTRFWYDLFIHGLGEFFYRNNIDFTQKDFLTIRSVVPPDIRHTNPDIRLSGDLVLVGGGKDSSVALGILKGSGRTLQTMVLNPTHAALENIRVSGFTSPLIVERTIDPKLLELNKSGYLNGHTPFSAYLAFLGVTVARLTGHENVIVSNEKSADEGNVVFHGMEINHQYSKSFRFEQSFRQYVSQYLPGAASYFSLLRPLNDVQIAELFTHYPEHFPVFRSCNAGSKTGVWCGVCAKCAFTYLILSPFLPFADMTSIFGSDYFTHPEIIGFIREMVGLTPVKPFECVGTRDEAKLSVYLAVAKYKSEGVEVPEGLLRIYADLNLSDMDIARLKEEVLEQWGDTYNVPAEHLSYLRRAWEGVSPA